MATDRTDNRPGGLELRCVRKGFGQRLVLDDVTFNVGRGEIAWIGGPNAAGKTTLLRVAAGLLRPEAGSVAIRSMDPARERRACQRRLGWLSAGERGLHARLTVGQNAEIAAALAFVPRGRRAGAIQAALGRFSLTHVAERRADRLSAGQRQRVRLALAFVQDPDVVLLDEPYASLDDDGLALVDAALGELRGRGGTAVWCSPPGDHGKLRADVAYEMRDGKPVPA